ncbi:hypothetical protein ACH419_31215 [Streptomyces bobili]|uniref:hypothetical protein n=1 Tax=Streptomyces bobili TaxID=67280 RepID=UPI003797ADF2
MVAGLFFPATAMGRRPVGVSGTGVIRQIWPRTVDRLAWPKPRSSRGVIGSPLVAASPRNRFSARPWLTIWPVSMVKVREKNRLGG